MPLFIHQTSRDGARATRAVYRVAVLTSLLLPGCSMGTNPSVDALEKGLELQGTSLQSLLSEQFVSAQNNGGGELRADAPVVDTWERFTLDDINGGSLNSGDQVHLKAGTGHYFQAYNGGGSTLTASSFNKLAWETFTIERVLGAGTIAPGELVGFRTASGHYIQAPNGGGSVLNASGTWLRDWEQFRITGIPTPAPTPVTIESVHFRTHLTGHYLKALENGGSSVDATAPHAQAWETFSVVDMNGGALQSGDRVLIQAGSGHYFQADQGGNAALLASSDNQLAWEQFTIEKASGSGEVKSGDPVALRAQSGWYVSATNGGGSSVNVTGAALDTWEMFTFLVGEAPIGDPPTDGGFKSVAFLNSIAGQYIVSGQHNDQKDGTDENHYTQRVQEITGKQPGLYGADFLFHGSSSMRWAITYEAERQWNAGALISLMWHACPPDQGSVCAWDGGLLSYLSDSEWNDLVTDGGYLNGVWKSRIDEIAVYLKYLEDKGVEVLWRPLHEQNQGAFWWGGRTGSNGTKRLFQLTHDYMTNVKGLHNLIWVWDVQDLSTDYFNYNPGSSFFDVAALDIYSDAYSNSSYYSALLQQAGGAPIAIGECFSLPPEWALQSQPQFSFFMNWAYGLEVDWNGNPTNSVEYIREVYNNPRVLTLDEMPGWN